jgi:hypothetical protein
VQQALVVVDIGQQAYAPQRRRAPLAARSLEVGPAVGQGLAHVVQQQVGVGRNGLARQRLAAERGRQRREQLAAGLVRGPVALRALGLVEQRLAPAHGRVAGVAPRRWRQRGLVEDHVV